MSNPANAALIWSVAGLLRGNYKQSDSQAMWYTTAVIGMIEPNECGAAAGFHASPGSILPLAEPKRNLEGETMKLDRITSIPTRMGGQPCIRDLRLTVRRVVELVAIYPDRSELRREYPELEDEDIRQALLYAATYLDDRVVEFSTPYEAAA